MGRQRSLVDPSLRSSVQDDDARADRSQVHWKGALATEGSTESVRIAWMIAPAGNARVLGRSFGRFAPSGWHSTF